MEFRTVTQINEHLIILVKNERKITQEILTHIYLFEKCNGPVKMGYSSTFQYLTRHLGYSDDQAYRRLKAAKVLSDVPEAAEQFQKGQLNLSQAAQAQKAFEQAQKENNIPVTAELKKDLLLQIKNQNNFNTEKILSESLSLKPSTTEKIKPQSNKTIQVQIQFTENQYKKIELLKSLVSHKVPEQKLADVLELALDFFIEKKSVVSKKLESSSKELSTSESSKQESIIKDVSQDESFKKNENQNKMNIRNLSQCLMETQKQCSKKRSYIPVKIKQKLFQRSGGCCENISESGVKCHSRFKLQIDHLHPLAFSGSNTIENLRHLCSSHNLLAASQMGIGFETVQSNLHI